MATFWADLRRVWVWSTPGPQRPGPFAPKAAGESKQVDLQVVPAQTVRTSHGGSAQSPITAFESSDVPACRVADRGLLQLHPGSYVLDLRCSAKVEAEYCANH